MVGRLSDPVPFVRDSKFEDDLLKIKESDRRRAETIADRCKEIRYNPFKGEWKKWAMDGLYGLHVQEKVILYELDPNISPNNDPSNVEEVYFWRIVHHDEQQTAVKNADSIGSAKHVSIRFEYNQVPNAQKFASDLYDSTIVEIKDDYYDSEGVSLEGSLVRENGETELRSLLPKSVEIIIQDPAISDVIEETPETD